MMHGEESALWQVWKRRLFVFAFLLFTLCLTVLPFWQKIGVQPTLFLIVLYYWTLYRPDLLAVEQLILISLIQDGLYAYPLGFSALRLLINYAFLLMNKRILSQQRFLWVWCGFALFTLLDGLICATLLSCVKREWVGLFPLFPGALMTISLYPSFVWAMNRFVKKRLPA